MASDLRASSRQCGLCRKLQSSVTPGSCRFLLRLSCSSLRRDGLDFSADTREAQPLCDKPHPHNLRRTVTRQIHVIITRSACRLPDISIKSKVTD